MAIEKGIMGARSSVSAGVPKSSPTASAVPSPLRPGSDVIERAAAILSAHTSGLTGAPALARAIPGGQPLPSLGGGGDLRQRAVDLVSELFSILGTQEAASQALTTLDALSVPWQKAPVGVAAGAPAQISLCVENQDDHPVEISLFPTDLRSDRGGVIPSQQISFDPPSRLLNPRESLPIKVSIALPLQTIPGSYSGLVQATGLPAVKAVITIEVL